MKEITAKQILIKLVNEFPGLIDGEADVNGGDLVDCLNEMAGDIEQAIKKNKKSETHVLVVIEGGLVQNIVTNKRDVRVAIIDYDSEDRDEEGDDVEDSASVDLSSPQILDSPLWKTAFKDATSEKEKYVVKVLKKNKF